LRVDEDCSGVDAPEKYEVDNGLHGTDRSRTPCRGQLDETVLSRCSPWRSPGRCAGGPVATCDDGAVSEQKPAAEPTSPATETQPGPFTFRVSQLALFVTFTLAICVTPLAISAFWLLPLYLIPIAAAYWVRRVGTTVDGDGLLVRGVIRARRVAWHEVTALRLRTRSRVSAVLVDGPELPLPAVHLRDLPLLAALSGGRIPDPAASPNSGPPTSPASPQE
jgi:hypothetical protein